MPHRLGATSTQAHPQVVETRSDLDGKWVGPAQLLGLAAGCASGARFTAVEGPRESDPGPTTIGDPGNVGLSQISCWRISCPTCATASSGRNSGRRHKGANHEAAFRWRSGAGLITSDGCRHLKSRLASVAFPAW